MVDGLDAELVKDIVEKGRWGNAVDIIIPENKDFFLVGLGLFDALHGPVHVFENERVVERW